MPWHGGRPGVLRWRIQRCSIVFLKSVTLCWIQENFGLFDFEPAPTISSGPLPWTRTRPAAPADPETFACSPG